MKSVQRIIKGIGAALSAMRNEGIPPWGLSEDGGSVRQTVRGE